MLFMVFDIETSVSWERVEKNPKKFQDFCERKHINSDEPEEASLYPAWSEVVCISFKRGKEPIQSFYGESESSILKDFSSVLEQDEVLVGHNIKKFDIPFLNNRYMYNRLKIPKPLRVAGMKPWEIPHLDTLEILKAGGWSATGLDDACFAAGISSPKSVITGLDVPLLANSHEFEQIREYCEGDVKATAKLFNLLYKTHQGVLG